MTAPIDAYYWPTPNGWKVTIALEEMGLPYNLRLIDIDNGEQRSPEFRAIAPNARMPAIVDPEGPDGQPIAIFESGAILMYLARKSGQFYGSNAREQIAVDQWLMWQMGGLGPIAGQAHHFLHFGPRAKPPIMLPYANDRFRSETARLYAVLDAQLAQNEFVAGDFYSIADMAIWPWASQWIRQEQTLDDKPHMRRWLYQLGRRPALVRGRLFVAEKRRETDAELAHRAEVLGQTG